MGVHFYDESPSGPPVQRARLGPALSISRVGIPCVVWAEEALSFVHRVPTGFFDLQILVPNGRVADAANAICTSLPYAPLDGDDPDSHWHDLKIYNPDRPHAFILSGMDTVVLKHSNPHLARKEGKPDRVLVHRASTYHFDITDASRTLLNPQPPGEAFAAIRFPTVAAFLDSLVDTQHEPPIPLYHMRFFQYLRVLRSYLSLYTLSDKGHSFLDEDGDPTERVLLPRFLQVLDQVKEENRPVLTREFMSIKPLDLENSVMERNALKAARFERLGLPYKPPPTILYNRYSDRVIRGGRPRCSKEPRLTPYLTRNNSSQLSVQWRALPKYASIAAKMLR
ncbi:hypothetical protein DFH06DRAFT_1156142 [Mycena polygramma]|nr:hypothetical protein DFH06DRAFT_1156142 [Mycena polygramma]